MPPVAVSIATSLAVAAVSSVPLQLVILLAGAALGTLLADAPSDNDKGQERRSMVRDSNAAMNIIYGRRRVSGPLVYWKTGHGVVGKEEALVMAVAFAGHQVNLIDTVYVGDKPFSSADLPSTTKYRFTKLLGTTTQTEDATLIAFGAPWTVAHDGKGIAYIVGEFDSYRDWERIPSLSADVEGALLYDPRKDGTVPGGVGLHRNNDATTWEYSTNPALQIRDYLTRVEGYNEQQFRIDEAFVIASANTCDTLVTTPNGSDKMYESNVSLPLTNSRKSNLQILKNSMKGEVVYVSGKWKIMAGEFLTPTITITENDVVGGIKITGNTSASSQFNYVTGSYFDTARFFQKSNFCPRSNPAFETRDGGRRVPKDLTYPAVTEEYLAQRHAVLDLNKTAHQIVVSLAVKPHLIDLHVNMMVNLTLSNPTWTDKSFRVIKLDLNPDLTLNLSLREENLASWDVPIGIYDTITAPGAGGQYNPYELLPHTLLIFDTGTSSANILLGGALQPVARLSWTKSLDGFLRDTKVRYRVTGGTEADWIDIVILATQISIDIPLDEAVGYDFDVIAINHRDLQSAPVSLVNRIVTASDVAPDQPGVITPTPIVLGAELTLDVSSITNNDLAFVEWAFSVINNVNDAGVVFLTRPVASALGSAATPPILTITEIFHTIGVRFSWARLVNTSGVASAWNSADTSGTITNPGETPLESMGVQGSVNFVHPSLFLLRLVGTESLTTANLGAGLPMQGLDIFVGDYVSFSAFITHSTETTAEIVLQFRGVGQVAIGSEFITPLPVVAAPGTETLVKFENIQIPTSATQLDFFSRAAGGLFFVRDPVLNKGRVVLHAAPSWGGRLIDPEDPGALIDYGDFQNLLDGAVEAPATVTPGTVAPGGGPVDAPSIGGGYYDNTQIP